MDIGSKGRRLIFWANDLYTYGLSGLLDIIWRFLTDYIDENCIITFFNPCLVQRYDPKLHVEDKKSTIVSLDKIQIALMHCNVSYRAISNTHYSYYYITNISGKMETSREYKKVNPHVSVQEQKYFSQVVLSKNPNSPD